ncbi:MAG: MFS transporter, partial [Gammaproteobacteria bacterium]|nr:MFS transporter [Gammaproteobacteria bacterium]
CLPEISKTLSTSLSEGGGMATARTVVMLFVLILAGVCAQKWGKKRFLTTGQYLLAAGLLMSSVAQNYPMFILSLMVSGIGGGFMEALVSPLVVDLHPQDSGEYMNITHAFYPIGVMISALFFGELLTLGYSWRWLFRLAALGALSVGIVFNLSRFPTPVHSASSPWKLGIKILVLPGFWLFAAAIFLGAGVESALTFWSRSYVAAYLKDVPRAGAIAVMIFAGTMAVGRFLTARLSQTMNLKTMLLGSALLGIGVSGMLPFAANLFWFYVLLALAGLAAACFWPTILAEAAACLQVDATLLFILLSCGGIAGFGFTPWLMGIIGDSRDLRTAFSVIPGLFALLLLVLVFEWRMTRKK